MRLIKKGSPPAPQMAIEEGKLIKAHADRRPGRDAEGAVGARQAPGEVRALMAETRTAEEIRRSIEANRAELGIAVERLRAEVAEVTDWRKQINKRRKQVLIGAAVAGFVLGGGIAALSGLVSGGGTTGTDAAGRARREAGAADAAVRRAPGAHAASHGDVDDGDGDPRHDGRQRPAEVAEPVGGRRGASTPMPIEPRATKSITMSRPSIRPPPRSRRGGTRARAGCGGPATAGRRAG